MYVTPFKLIFFCSQLTTKVFDKHTMQPTDSPLPIQIIVDDVNDNAPEFKSALQFSVLEHSKSGQCVSNLLSCSV